MNYGAMKKSLVAFGAGMALWCGTGYAGVETTPFRMIKDMPKIGILESLVQDSTDTRTLPGAAGKMLTYVGIFGAGLSLANKKE